ncbi:hypothetical protein CYMTET_8690 [Cymbomonas tetramitiformis]|uniref:Endonuclease/exonuclease/phosphatase domain-containing protein n=1 Tax=Cymbomonas tetramitiformis TaxID=36881 RepID=A0AAE0GT00_9CHLO|nr:hypothetical protein CYMTET_8690 [Cymbomonas tetramitiformis]
MQGGGDRPEDAGRARLRAGSLTTGLFTDTGWLNSEQVDEAMRIQDPSSRASVSIETMHEYLREDTTQLTRQMHRALNKHGHFQIAVCNDTHWRSIMIGSKNGKDVMAYLYDPYGPRADGKVMSRLKTDLYGWVTRRAMEMKGVNLGVQVNDEIHQRDSYNCGVWVIHIAAKWKAWWEEGATGDFQKYLRHEQGRLSIEEGAQMILHKRIQLRSVVKEVILGYRDNLREPAGPGEIDARYAHTAEDGAAGMPREDTGGLFSAFTQGIDEQLRNEQQRTSQQPPPGKTQHARGEKPDSRRDEEGRGTKQEDTEDQGQRGANGRHEANGVPRQEGGKQSRATHSEGRTRRDTPAERRDEERAAKTVQTTLQFRPREQEGTSHKQEPERTHLRPPPEPNKEVEGTRTKGKPPQQAENENETNRAPVPRKIWGGGMPNTESLDHNKMNDGQQHMLTFLTWNIQGSGYSLYELEEQMQRWKVDVAVVTETKSANADIRRHFMNKEWSHICTSAPGARGGEKEGERHTAGLAVILRGEYAKPHNYTEVKVPHLQGVLTHTLLHFPGAKYIHLIGVYYPVEGRDDLEEQQGTGHRRITREELRKGVQEYVQMVTKASTEQPGETVLVCGDLNATTGVPKNNRDREWREVLKQTGLVDVGGDRQTTLNWHQHRNIDRMLSRGEEHPLYSQLTEDELTSLHTSDHKMICATRMDLKAWGTHHPTTQRQERGQEERLKLPLSEEETSTLKRLLDAAYTWAQEEEIREAIRMIGESTTGRHKRGAIDGAGEVVVRILRSAKAAVMQDANLPKKAVPPKQGHGLHLPKTLRKARDGHLKERNRCRENIASWKKEIAERELKGEGERTEEFDKRTSDMREWEHWEREQKKMAAREARRYKDYLKAGKCVRPNQAKNYRPIALLDCLFQLYTAILTKMLADFCEINGMLSQAQEGSREKHNTMRQLTRITNATEDANLSKRELHATYVDFENAYGWLEIGNHGYQHKYTTDRDTRGELSTSSGAFVDDLIILTKRMTGMEEQLRKLAAYGNWSGLKINPDKTKITGVEYGNREVRESKHKGVKCGHRTLKVLKAGDTYTYLGVHLNMRGDWKEEKHKLLQELHRRIEALLATPLTQRQKEYSLKSAVLGKFRYGLHLGIYTHKEIQQVENKLGAALKRIYGLPVNGTPNELTTEAKEEYGLGLQSLQAIYAQEIYSGLAEAVQSEENKGAQTNTLRKLNALNEYGVHIQGTGTHMPALAKETLPIMKQLADATRVYTNAEMEGTTRKTKYQRRMDDELRDPEEQPMTQGTEKMGAATVVTETREKQATKRINFTKMLTLFRAYQDLKHLTTADGRKALPLTAPKATGGRAHDSNTAQKIRQGMLHQYPYICEEQPNDVKNPGDH